MENDRPRAEIVRRFITRHDVPFLVSDIVLLECENVFASIAAAQNPLEWQRLVGEIGTKVTKIDFAWEQLAVDARSMIRRFSHKAPISTFDTMILAAAVKAEATHFLSFDKNSNLRALAAVLKLKVFPELTADDKRRMAVLR